MKKWSDEEIQDLIDRLNGEYKVGPDGVYGKRDFSDFIPPISKEAASALQQLLDERRWVPVSERLPGIGQPVSCAKYFKEQKEWWFAYCTYRDFGFPFASYPPDEPAVTHWMPLPPPPKEEG